MNERKHRTVDKPAKQLRAEGWRCLARPVKPGSAELDAIIGQLGSIRYILRELKCGKVEVWRDARGWLHSRDESPGRPVHKRRTMPMPKFVREYLIGKAEAAPDCNRTLKVITPSL